MADTYPPLNPDSQHAPSGFQWPVVLLLVLLALLVGRFFPGGGTGNGPNNASATARAVVARGDLAADEKSTIELFQKASPSVVHIATTTVRRDSLSRDVTEIPQGTGSGFIWDKSGHVVTNFHVIKEAGRAKVTLADSSTWDAKLVGVAPDKDLAVLKITAPSEQLQPIAVGESKNLQVGQKVYAIGNPFGLDQSLTVGIISGLNRQIRSVTNRPITGMIQIDAAINPGNSGGPLLDSAERLIGINTAILSPSGAYAGIGFAVPVDMVNRIVPQLLEHGKIVRPGLGITTADERLVRRAGLTGVLIVDLDPNGAAAKAGLRPNRRDENGSVQLGDRIIAIDKLPIQSADDLYKILDSHSVGDQIIVSVRRDGEEAEVEVPLSLQALP